MGKAKNYGSGLENLISTFPELPIDTVTRLDKGYYKAYPDVLKYQNAVIEARRKLGYVENLFGRRYYLKDGNLAYKLGNYLIQGSSADILKEKIILADEYIEKNKIKTQFMMNVHDEMQFTSVKGEEKHILELQKIMKEDRLLIPIPADLEVTYTNWAEKKDCIL